MDKSQKPITLKLLIIISLFGMPIVALITDFLHPGKPHRHLFTTFIILVITERIFETFYTNKRNLNRAEADWTIKAVTIA